MFGKRVILSFFCLMSSLGTIFAFDEAGQVDRRTRVLCCLCICCPTYATGMAQEQRADHAAIAEQASTQDTIVSERRVYHSGWGITEDAIPGLVVQGPPQEICAREMVYIPHPDQADELIPTPAAQFDEEHPGSFLAIKPNEGLKCCVLLPSIAQKGKTGEGSSDAAQASIYKSHSSLLGDKMGDLAHARGLDKASVCTHDVADANNVAKSLEVKLGDAEDMSPIVPTPRAVSRCSIVSTDSHCYIRRRSGASDDDATPSEQLCVITGLPLPSDDE